MWNVRFQAGTWGLCWVRPCMPALFGCSVTTPVTRRRPLRGQPTTSWNGAAPVAPRATVMTSTQKSRSSLLDRSTITSLLITGETKLSCLVFVAHMCIDFSNYSFLLKMAPHRMVLFLVFFLVKTVFCDVSDLTKCTKKSCFKECFIFDNKKYHNLIFSCIYLTTFCTKNRRSWLFFNLFQW